MLKTKEIADNHTPHPLPHASPPPPLLPALWTLRASGGQEELISIIDAENEVYIAAMSRCAISLCVRVREKWREGAGERGRASER